MGGDERGSKVNEESKEMINEVCALLMSPRIWEGIEGHGWKGSRIV